MSNPIYKTGDRIVTESGQKGTILPTTTEMPEHYLIGFADGKVYWTIKSAIKAIDQSYGKGGQS